MRMFGRNGERIPKLGRRRMVRMQALGAIVLAALAGALIAAPGLLASRDVDHVRTTAGLVSTTTSTTVDRLLTTTTFGTGSDSALAAPPDSTDSTAITDPAS